MNPWVYLQHAAFAAQRNRNDHRSYAVGALAIRADGASTVSRNEAAQRPSPEAHAERRVLRKAGLGAVIFVARMRRDGSLGLAHPCKPCVVALRAHRVRRCYYSIDDDSFGVLVFRY